MDDSLWLDLNFENYKMINTDIISDKISVQFINTSIILS